jgi:hypothetical protein
LCVGVTCADTVAFVFASGLSMVTVV